MLLETTYSPEIERERKKKTVSALLTHYLNNPVYLENEQELTQKQFAKNIAVDAGTVSRWKRGAAAPSYANLLCGLNMNEADTLTHKILRELMKA